MNRPSPFRIKPLSSSLLKKRSVRKIIYGLLIVSLALVTTHAAFAQSFTVTDPTVPGNFSATGDFPQAYAPLTSDARNVPSSNPPISSVRPTFKGLNVQGPIFTQYANGEKVDVNGLDLYDYVNVWGRMNVLNGIWNTGIGGPKPIEIYDNVQIMGASYLQVPEITNNFPGNAAVLRINDDVSFTGGATFAGIIDTASTIWNSGANAGGSVSINDSLNVTGNIANSAGNLVLNDTVDIRTEIINSTGTLSLNDNVTITGTLTAGSFSATATDIKTDIRNSDPNEGVVVNDALRVNGPLEVIETNPGPGANTGLIVRSDTNDAYLWLDGENANASWLIETGENNGAPLANDSSALSFSNNGNDMVLDRSGNLFTNGNIQAKGVGAEIGHFYISTCTSDDAICPNSANANRRDASYKIIYPACNTGDFRTSCSGYTDGNQNMFKGARENGALGCVAGAVNTNDTHRLYGTAWCFSPDG